MIYTKGRALNSLKPGAQWAWNGDEYSGLTWQILVHHQLNLK